ncbi:MAG: polysaccharide deacetylase family protein [Burkholderiales bacterium]|nr:polysaccharide deacetylase family protein [Burkholderiales bacterium]
MKHLLACVLIVLVPAGVEAASCAGTVYLTIDTGNMQPADEMASVLKKHDIKATFFLANEKTTRGDTSLDPSWTAFWKARADEGHAFGSHTWRHWVFRRDAGTEKVSYVPAGATSGETLDAAGVCAELKAPEIAFRKMTGRGFDGIWRAPGGKLTPNATQFAKSCGFDHVPWTAAGFSGDELPSEKFPSDALIKTQIRTIKDGDILLWHLGIWSRKDPLYLRLDELVSGLKAKGLCFAPITEHARWKK